MLKYITDLAKAPYQGQLDKIETKITFAVDSY